MNKVMQTIFTGPDSNCFQACIASILELPLEKVPNFCGLYDKYWLPKTIEWLKQKGYNFVFGIKETPIIPLGGLIILDGISPRFPDKFHASIYRLVNITDVNCEWVLAHDPHPDNDGVGTLKDWLYIYKDPDIIKDPPKSTKIKATCGNCVFSCQLNKDRFDCSNRASVNYGKRVSPTFGGCEYWEKWEREGE